MTKPDVTLQPSKGIVVQAAAQIFAGYLASGRVDDANEEECLKRAIRAAVSIARLVDSAVQSDAELPSFEGARGEEQVMS